MGERERRLFKMGEATIETSLELATAGIPFFLTPRSPSFYQINLDLGYCVTKLKKSPIIHQDVSNLIAFGTDEHLNALNPKRDREDARDEPDIYKSLAPVVGLRNILLKSGKSLSYNQIAAFAGDFYESFEELENDVAILYLAKNYPKISVSGVSGVAKNFLGDPDPVNLGLLEHYTVNYLLYANHNFTHFRIPIKCNDDPSRDVEEIGYPNAVQAYKKWHRLALEEANSAGLQSKVVAKKGTSSIRRAFAINAFGDHFLEDLFSTGHMRVPRYHVHYSIRRGEWFLNQTKVSLAAHDEDNDLGLWVKSYCDCPGTISNHKGGRRDDDEDQLCKDPWRAFGDGSLFKNPKHAEKLNTALHISAYEVNDAYQEGKEGRNLLQGYYFHVLVHLPIPYPPGIVDGLIQTTDPWDPDYKIIMGSRERSGQKRLVLEYASGKKKGIIDDETTKGSSWASKGNCFPRYIMNGEDILQRAYPLRPWLNSYIPFEVKPIPIIGDIIGGPSLSEMVDKVKNPKMPVLELR